MICSSNLFFCFVSVCVCVSKDDTSYSLMSINQIVGLLKNI